MTGQRSRGTAAALVLIGFALSGCGSAAPSAAPGETPAVLKAQPNGAPGVVSLSEHAVQRLGVRTAAVTAGGTGLVVPYDAVVYQPDGSSWAFVQTAPRTYQRAAIAVTAVTGDQAVLASGPSPGTLVVTVGAPELVGVETGIDGEQ
jgi:hypothetical protein